MGSARAADALVLRVGFVPVIGASALFVMDKAGWARDAFIDLQTTKFDSGPPAIQAFASGTLDVLVIGVAPVAVARARGVDVSIVAAASNGGSSFIAAPPLAAQFAAADGNAAAAFAQFRKVTGRPAKLATMPRGGVPAVALDYWLFETGHVAHEDVQIVAIGIDAVQQAILAGAVDGATVLEPSATIVLARDSGLKAIVSARDMFTDIPGVVWAVSGKLARAQPQVVTTLVSLAARATRFIVETPNDAAPFVAEFLGKGLIEPAVMAKAMASKAVQFSADPRAIAAPTGAMLAYQAQIGDFTSAPPIQGLFDYSFWDAAKK